MPLTVQASAELLGSLQEKSADERAVSALLVGFASQGAVQLVSKLCQHQDSDVHADAGQLELVLPGGLHVCGCRCSDPSMSSKLQGTTGLPMIAACGQELLEITAGQPRPVDVQSVGTGPSYTTLRIHEHVQLQVLTTSGSREHDLPAAFSELEKSLLPQQGVWLAETAAGPLFLGAQPADTLCRMLSSEADQTVPVRCLSHEQPQNAASPNAGPVWTWQPYQGAAISITTCTLELDILVCAPQDMPASQLPEALLRPSVLRQLAAMRAALEKYGLQNMQALHFQPAPLPHPVTLVYPCSLMGQGDLEPQLAEQRRQVHALLGLPLSQPLFRSWQALLSPTASGAEGAQRSALASIAAEPKAQGAGKGQRLSDVHLSLPSLAGADPAHVHTIWGSYDYHHYMQDGVDDRGWGCAYRSLQTICSWFRAQRFTSAPVPSHKDMQLTLVKLGDKQRGFMGSKEWIGAVELSYVLDELLGVTSKIISVSSGSEIESRAAELAAHFQQQGTPIMIGGGVLAYTLLGVHHNPLTEECAFLILDPHYTGSDDLDRVLGGRWVAWQRAGGKAAAGGPLFVNSAHYNFLCPQRPGGV